MHDDYSDIRRENWLRVIDGCNKFYQFELQIPYVVYGDLCACRYSQEVIQSGKVFGWQGCKSTNSCLVLIMTTLEAKQILKLAQTVKDAHNGWSNYPPESS